MSVVANVAINVDSRNAVSKLREVQAQAATTERAFNGVAAAAGKLAIAFGALQAAKFVFAKTAELESQTRSLEVLTGSAQKAGKIIKELQQLGAVTPFTSTELIDSAKRLQAFGVEADKVVKTTKRLADVSGATGAELQGLVTAYGQVQAKGRLQGEELLQFQERGVALQEELRKMYGLSGEEFQKALEKGRIGSEAVEVAILRLTSAGGKYANGAIAQSDTLNGRLSTLQDSIGVLAQTIGNTLAPVFQWALTQATAVVSEIQRVIDEANNTGGARDREAQFARNADAAVRGMGLNPFTQQGMMADMRQRNIEQQRADYRLRQQTARTPSAPVPMGVPALLGGGGGGGGRAGGGGGAAAVRESRIPALQRELEINQVLVDIKQKIRLAELAGDKETLIRLNLEEELARINGKQAEILASKEPLAEKQLQLDLLDSEANEKRLDTATELVKLQKQELRDALEKLGITQQLADEAERYRKALFGDTGTEEFGKRTPFITNQALVDLNPKGQKIREFIADAEAQLKDLESVAIRISQGIGDAVANSLTNGIQGLIAGTTTAKEVFATFLSDVGQILAQEGAKMIATYIAIGIAKMFAGLMSSGSATGIDGSAAGKAAFGGSFAGTGSSTFGSGGITIPGFGARANGGPVTGGAPYLVGERGPELFVPNANGSVVSNADTRAALAQQAAGRQTNDTRAMLNQQTANRQMNTGSTAVQQKPIEVKYESTVINGVEYVTAEQHQRGIALAAERGRSLTLQTLQNSVKTRKRVGMA